MTLAMRRLVERVAPQLGGRLRHVGLHFEGEHVSAAQLRLTGAAPAIHAAGTLHLGGPWQALVERPGELRRALRGLWSEHGFRGRSVVAAMPQEQLKVFTVDYTAAPGQSDAEAIAGEVQERLKGRADTMVVDFVPVRPRSQDERAKQAVVAAAAREEVVAFLELLRRAGLDVRALDIASMALRRVVPRAGEGAGEAREHTLLVDIGITSSHLMVVWGRRLMLDRTIEFCEQRLIARIMKLLDVPQDSARALLAESVGADGQPGELHSVLREVSAAELLELKNEVKKTLDYAAYKTRGRSIDRILLVGNLASTEGLASLIGESLGRPVEPLDPLQLFAHRLRDDERARLSRRCGVAVAVGLALRGMTDP